MDLRADIQTWLDNPNGGGMFTGQRDAIRAHDPTCKGLANVWLPRKGGVTALGDITDCAGDCDVTFYNEGAYESFEGCVRHWYCPCCFAKADHCPCPTLAALDQPGDQEGTI